MTTKFHKIFGGAALCLAAIPMVLAPIAPAFAQASGELNVLSIGRGKQINLPEAVTDVFIANPAVADVDVKSPRQLYIFGKGQGETTLYATNAQGRTIYQTTIRVGGNIDSIDQMLSLTMPDARISVSTMNGIVLLTGTVQNPTDAAEAEDLVQTFVGKDTKVVSRLKVATPLQVNLRVRFAEVNRNLSKEISSNLATRDTTGGFQLGAIRGRAGAVTASPASTAGLPVLDASSLYGLPAGTISLPFDPVRGQFVGGGTDFTYKAKDPASMVTMAASLFGLDVGAAFDLTEKMGLTVMLAEPNLTVSSGSTGEFLAGGEIPVPVPSGNNGQITIEYKQYGVALQYTPTVLANGRISLRLRPEVSELDYTNTITLNGSVIPGLKTRRVETTVELGSGQSFMIAGLLNNSSASQIDKIPGAGDIPILGNLFKSNQWRRNETELVIVVTPYLVQPVSDSEIKLPTDGYKSATDIDRLLLNRNSDGESGGERPMPRAESSVSYTPATPGFLGAGQAAPAYPPAKSEKPKKAKKQKQAKGGQKSTPGFSYE